MLYQWEVGRVAPKEAVARHWEIEQEGAELSGTSRRFAEDLAEGTIALAAVPYVVTSAVPTDPPTAGSPANATVTVGTGRCVAALRLPCLSSGPEPARRQRYKARPCPASS